MLCVCAGFVESEFRIGFWSEWGFGVGLGQV